MFIIMFCVYHIHVYHITDFALNTYPKLPILACPTVTNSLQEVRRDRQKIDHARLTGVRVLDLIG